MNRAISTNNVISMPTPDLTAIHVRAFAGLRALDKLTDKLAGVLKTAKAKRKADLEAATKEYREPIRAEFDAVVGKEIDLSAKDKATTALTKRYATNFIAVVRGVKHHDDTKAKEDAVVGAIEERIDKLQIAMKECLGAASANGQGDLFAPGGGVVDGLGWATASTRQAMYTALRELDRDKVVLDPFQATLLVDLGGAGIEELDLGLAASEAVEADGIEADPTESTDDDDDVGF